MQRGKFEFDSGRVRVPPECTEQEGAPSTNRVLKARKSEETEPVRTSLVDHRQSPRCCLLQGQQGQPPSLPASCAPAWPGTYRTSAITAIVRRFRRCVGCKVQWKRRTSGDCKAENCEPPVPLFCFRASRGDGGHTAH